MLCTILFVSFFAVRIEYVFRSHRVSQFVAAPAVL
jgi:hypothetical protein